MRYKYIYFYIVYVVFDFRAFFSMYVVEKGGSAAITLVERGLPQFCTLCGNSRRGSCIYALCLCLSICKIATKQLV